MASKFSARRILGTRRGKKTPDGTSEGTVCRDSLLAVCQMAILRPVSLMNEPPRKMSFLDQTDETEYRGGRPATQVCEPSLVSFCTLVSGANTFLSDFRKLLRRRLL